MSPSKTLSFEEVNAHVEQHLSDDQLKGFAATTPNICGIYGTVKPILTLISQFVLIPQKWRDAIKVLISTLDVLCPGH